MSDEELTLNKLRNQISSMGASEFDSREQLPELQEMFDELQALKMEMNEAKKRAAAEAARPYEELMKEITDRYMFIIKLTS